MKDGVSILDIPRSLFPLLMARGVFGFISTIGFYLAIDYLPLSLGTTIYYT
jgi:drug/metabolite transporter (DMT)-like permease